MPVNFKSTFEEPLKAAFDGGQVFSGQDIAKNVAQNYLTTIKSGLGPNGTPPAAYLIADGRAKLMENILSLYYQAKDIENLQDNIKEISSNVTNLVAKGKKLQQDVTRVVTSITQTTQEMALIPIELARLMESVVTSIKSQIEKINNIVNTEVVYIFDSVPLVNDEAFINSFEKYKVKLEVIKNLPQTMDSIISDITPFNASQKITQIVNIPTFIVSLVNDAKGDYTAVGLLVQDIGKKLEIAFAQLITLIRTIVDPTKALKLLEDVATSNPAIKKIYDKVKGIVDRLKFLSKKLDKLNKEKDIFIERIEREVTNRIEKYETILKEKLKTLQSKIESAANTESKIQFLAKTIKSVKDEIAIIYKKISPIVKEIVKNAMRIQKVLMLVQAAVALIEEIKTELEQFISEIKAQSTKAALLFQQMGSLYQNEYNKVIGLIEEGKVAATNATSLVTNLKDQLKDPAQFANAIALSAQEIKTNVDKLTSNFNQRGLSRYMTILSAPIMAGAATEIQLRQYLEYNSTKYKNIYTKAQIIVNDALDMYDEMKAEVEKRPYVKKVREIAQIRGVSLSTDELFKKLNGLFKKLDKVEEAVRKKIDELQQLALKYVDLAVKKTVAYFEKLLAPVVSFIDDKRRKIQEKFEEVQAKILEQKKLVELGQVGLYLGLTVKELVEFGTNLSTGNFRYNDNEGVIKRAFGNYSKADKILRKTTVDQEAATKRVFDKILERLRVFDSVMTIITNLAREVKTNGDKILEQLRLSFANNQGINRVRQILIDFIELLRNLKNPIEILNFIFSRNLNFEDLKNSSVITYLVALERTFLQKTKEFVAELGSISEIKINLPLPEDSTLVYVLDMLQKAHTDMTRTAKQFMEKKLAEVMKEIEIKIEKIKHKALTTEQIRLKKTIDTDGKSLTAAIYQSLVAFWTGSTWTNPSGDVVQVISPGTPPPPLMIPASGGTTNYIGEITKALYLHLKTITGTYIQQTPSGPVTIPWIGYN